MIGGHLFQGELINDMLKVPEKAFKHEQWQVRAAAFDSWQQLIDSMSQQPKDLCKKKRLTLLLKPIATCIKSDHSQNVIAAIISCWTYLLSRLGVYLMEVVQSPSAPSFVVFDRVVPRVVSQILKRLTEFDLHTCAFEVCAKLFALRDVDGTLYLQDTLAGDQHSTMATNGAPGHLGGESEASTVVTVKPTAPSPCQLVSTIVFLFSLAELK